MIRNRVREGYRGEIEREGQRERGERESKKERALVIYLSPHANFSHIFPKILQRKT